MQSKYPETKKVYLRTGYIADLLRTSMKFIFIECPCPGQGMFSPMVVADTRY